MPASRARPKRGKAMKQEKPGQGPVSEELAETILRAVVRFQRLALKENRRPVDMPPEGAGHERHAGRHTPHHFRHGEMMMLFAVCDTRKEHPAGVTVSDLSRLLHVKPPSITAPLNALEKRGMVRREQDKEDRRAVRVFITDEGMALLTHMRDKLYGRVYALVAYLGQARAAELLGLMDDVYAFALSEREKRRDKPPDGDFPDFPAE